MSKTKLALKSFFFELLIVFVGVYGAFELNRYQQNSREDKVEFNYLTAFLSELNNIRSHAVSLKEEVNGLIAKHETAAIGNSRPDLRPPNFYFYHGLLITQIGLSDDVFVQLSPGLATSLSGGYDFIQRLTTRIKDFNDLCNDRLISNTPINFYDSEGNIKESFSWYLKGLKTIEAELTTLLSIIDEGALPATKQLLEELE